MNHVSYSNNVIIDYRMIVCMLVRALDQSAGFEINLKINRAILVLIKNYMYKMWATIMFIAKN